jgi:hypothetical protein
LSFTPYLQYQKRTNIRPPNYSQDWAHSDKKKHVHDTFLLSTKGKGYMANAALNRVLICFGMSRYQEKENFKLYLLHPFPFSFFFIRYNGKIIYIHYNGKITLYNGWIHIFLGITIRRIYFSLTSYIQNQKQTNIRPQLYLCNCKVHAHLPSILSIFNIYGDHLHYTRMYNSDTSKMN